MCCGLASSSEFQNYCDKTIKNSTLIPNTNCFFFVCLFGLWAIIILKSYKKSLIATKNTNKTENQIKTNKTNKIQNSKNKVVGYPDGIGKKIEMPSHVFHGPEDHSHSLETEDHKDSEPGKPKTGPGTERGEKKNGTPSGSLNIKVGPSLMKDAAGIDRKSTL